MFASFTAFIMGILSLFYGAFGWGDVANRYTFRADGAAPGGEIGNLTQCVNVWDMGTAFYEPQKNEKYDVFRYVEYVQLMQCTGGDAGRDLFRDPADRSVTDDYDFTRLIKNCAGILSLGAKPHLKFGNVPLKLTTDPEKGVFSGNVNPPDDYGAYYNYIRACAGALADEFGADEVRRWRFGVMTEYENSDWFRAKSGDPAETAEAYCKLYDYTVAALQDALGEEITVGAHSMTVTEGLWDEEIFIRHCAEGVNYCTGKKGSRLCYLSASFYDSRPGEPTSGKTLPETIGWLRRTAEKYGFTDLFYGVDEGRILCGVHAGAESDELFSRSAGATWQGAYDARQYGQLIDNGASYFSYWHYLTGGLTEGFPTVSYHVSDLISRYNGSRSLPVRTVRKGLNYKADVNAHAAWDERTRTLRAFVYNFKYDLNYFRPADVTLELAVPQLKDSGAVVRIFRIDDDCNYFDEWTADRAANGITDDMFSWSPDDGCVLMMRDQRAKDLFNGNYKKYETCARLTPDTEVAEVRDGVLTLRVKVPANTAVFFEITQP